MITTLDKILYLVPQAKVVVWQTDNPEDYHGENTPVLLDGFLVDWKSEEVCPTQEQLDSIDLRVLADTVTARDESQRKAARDEAAKGNFGVLAGLLTARVANPDLTLTNYLDQLESLEV